MRRYLSPLAALLGVLLAVAMITFAIQAALPGDAAEVFIGRRDDLTTQQRDELVEKYREQLGLDKALPVQFGIWLSKAARLDLGEQIGGGAVRPAVLSRLLPSLELALLTLLISVPFATLLAVASVRRRRRWLGPIADGWTTVGFVMPTFWIGFLLVVVFAVKLRWLPADGYVSFGENPTGHLVRLIMPVLTLSIAMVGLFYHFMRQSLREALASQFIRTARAKGLSETRILYRHALPNALLPSLTVLGIQFGQLIGGVVIVEQVFNWPGIGGLLLYAVDRQDYNTLIACVMAIAVAFVFFSTLTEIVYRVVDPRIRKA